MKDKSKAGTYAVLVLIILVCNAVMLFIFAGKSDIHIDEVWSYSLSNSHEKPYLFTWRTGTGEIGSESRTYRSKEGETDPFYSDEYNVFYEQWHDKDEFHDYLTVQENERFDYKNVFYNQTCDVHPPLYYLLLHTVCSFFPDSFSIWYAASINLLFYSLSLIMLFLLGRQVLGSDKKALLAAAFWGLSRAGLSDAAFLRMYMMMTFFVITLAFLHMRFIKEYRIKYVVLIFAVNVAGFLTQYYFYIFSFFIAASVCFYLLFKKQIKRLSAYAFAVLASVGTALFVFPAAFFHLTQGAYTDTTINGLMSLSYRSDLLADILQDYTGLAYYDKTLLADWLPIIAVMAALMLWLRFCKKETDKKAKILSVIKGIDPAYAILLISVILSGIVTEKISPDMLFFGDRYVFGLLPLFSPPFVSVVCFAAKKATARFKWEKHAFITAATVLAVFSVLSNTLNVNRYFGQTRNTEKVNNIIAEAADEGTFYYVANREYMIHSFSVMFKNSDKVYAAHGFDEKLAERINENEVNAKTAYVLFEASDAAQDQEGKNVEIKGTELAIKYAVKHDYEFVTDFCFGNDIFGDIYLLYRVNY